MILVAKLKTGQYLLYDSGNVIFWVYDPCQQFIKALPLVPEFNFFGHNINAQLILINFMDIFNVREFYGLQNLDVVDHAL